MDKLPFHLVVVVGKCQLLKCCYDNNGCTPLWWASYEGKHEVIEWLIASGRDLGDFENKKGRGWEDGQDLTALEIAREEHKTKVVSLKDSWPIQPRPAMSFV